MKIVIRSKEANFTIPIPMFMITSGIKFTHFISNKLQEKSTSDIDSQEFIKYMNYLDMDALMYGMKELKKHKGLILVEVKAKDGTYVLVKV